ncbi:MAG: hypothetical protein Q7J57_16495 [Gemmobacter sp.]|nr:hypothetical protein [Gemmobacter sp.]
MGGWFRVVALGVGMLQLLACLAMAVNGSVLLLPVVIFALRFTGLGMADHVSIVARARRFVATRGWVMAVSTLGFQAGEAAMPMGLFALKRVVDWQVLWATAVMGSAIGPGISGALIDGEMGIPVQMVSYAVWFVASSAWMIAPVAQARLAMTPQVNVIGA